MSCFLSSAYRCVQTYFDDIFKVLAGSVAELKLGPGEDNSYDFTLYKEWTRKTTIGASTYKCTNTKTMYEAFCNGQVSLTADSGGTIQLQGLVSVNSEDDQVLAIIGGTGKYIGARGQVVGVKQTAQGGIKHSATFSVWTQNEDADEAIVTESSIPKASGNSTAAATTSTTKKAPATKATTTKKTTATKKTNSTKSS
jgi:hypothetical protein